MDSLKRSSLLSILIGVLVIGCQHTHQSFSMNTDHEKELNVIEVDTNRVIQECYFMNAEKENNWRHQYILHILNERNEVISLYNPTNQGKEECLLHMKKVQKILKNESKVKLCARDILEKTISEDVVSRIHDFGALGKYKSLYDGLTFDTICNSKECYGIGDTWTYTCPDFKK